MSGQIYTLGPTGTDSETAALTVSNDVVLCKDFRSAFQGGVGSGADVLCPAGYVRIEDGVLKECWADLHFEYESKFAEVRVFRRPTREMALYENRRVHNHKLVCHPTTRAIAAMLLREPVEYVHVNSKPIGRRIFEEGGYQFVLCSKVEESKEWETEVARYSPSMVWVHYRSKTF